MHILQTFAAARVNQGLLFAFLSYLWFNPSYCRISQRRAASSILKSLLGVELAIQDTAAGFAHSSDTIGTSFYYVVIRAPKLIILQVIVIIAPPPNIAYPFILDVEGYPGQIINLFIALVSRCSTSVFLSCSPIQGLVLAEVEEA